LSARSLCLVLALCAPIAVPPVVAKDCEFVGKIDGILAGKERVETANHDQVTLSREGAGIPVTSGLPLCAGDVIFVFEGTTLHLKMGTRAEEENTITLYGGTRTELSAADSLTLKIGRLFAFLKGPFQATTNFGLLGAQGTAFQVEASEQSLSVLQVENTVDFHPPGTRPATGKRKGPASRVDRLNKLTVEAGTDHPTTEPLSLEQCRSVVDGDSQVVTRTRPEYASNVVGTALSGADAAVLFERNRGSALCEEVRAARVQVGRAYATWGRATDALQVLGSKPEAGAGEDASTLNDTGNAYRLAGDLDRALDYYRRGIEQDPKFAFPYNGTGDVHRDRALKALGGGFATNAMTELQEARGWYERSLASSLHGKEGGHNRAVPLYNLGEVELMLALLEPDKGEEHCRGAEERFREALSNARFPFAQVGLARVHLMRAQLIRGQAAPAGAKLGAVFAQSALNDMMTKKLRAPFLENAEREIRETLRIWPSLSLAEQTLGEILEMRGDRAQAIERLLRAVQLDPNNAVAYARLGRIGGRGRKAYQRVAGLIEPKAAGRITQGRVRLAEPLEPKKPEPPRLEIDPSELTVSGKPVTLRLRNAGPGPLRIESVQLEGETKGLKIGDACSGRTLAEGEECVISIEAYPGTYKGALVIRHGGTGSPSSVPVQGTIIE